MAFDLFSCCWPGGKQRGNKVSYSRLEQNGALDTRPNSGDSRIQRDEGKRHDVEGAVEGSYQSSLTKRDDSQDAMTPTTQVSEQQQCERVTPPVVPTAPAQRSSGPMGERTGYSEGSSIRTSANVTTICQGNGRQQIHGRGYGSSIQTVRPPYQASTVRHAGPRIIHAHPKDQRQAWVPGADVRSVAPRSRPQTLAPRRQGGGRFGAVVLTAAGAAGARAPAVRGFQAAIPGASRSVLAKYEMKEVLGIGSTSTCYRCVDRASQKQFACKVRESILCWSLREIQSPCSMILVHKTPRWRTLIPALQVHVRTRRRLLFEIQEKQTDTEVAICMPGRKLSEVRV